MKRGPTPLDRLIAWAPVLLLASLAALAYWLDAQIQQQQARRDGNARHHPDLFVQSFKAVSFDTDGRVRQALAATLAQHYPDDESMDFIAPLLVLTDPGKPRFSVAADRGTLTGDRETISLIGNVHALRDAVSAPAAKPQKQPAKSPAGPIPTLADADGPSGPVSITTEFLRIVPKQGLASTDKAVTIEEPRGIIHAVGMELDNNAKTLKLRSGVRGSLQPPPAN